MLAFRTRKHNACSLPLEKSSLSWNTTRTFVQSRSSMGEWSVGRTHTLLCTRREGERICYLTPLHVVLQSPVHGQKVIPGRKEHFLANADANVTLVFLELNKGMRDHWEMSKASIYREEILANTLSTPAASDSLYLNTKYKFNIRERRFCLGKMAAAVEQNAQMSPKQNTTKVQHVIYRLQHIWHSDAPACVNRGGQPLARWRLSWLHKRRANVQRLGAQSAPWQQLTPEETHLPACTSVFKRGSRAAEQTHQLLRKHKDREDKYLMSGISALNKTIKYPHILAKMLQMCG